MKNKPLFFSVVDQQQLQKGSSREKLTHGPSDSRQTSIEDSHRYNGGKMTHISQHRHALSSANSPKFTPSAASSQLPLKSPFLQKEQQLARK